MSNDARAAQTSAIARFHALHEAECFVIPNPWDVGTAVFLHHVGFEALATTSAGVSYTRGKPDTLEALALDEVLAHVRDLAAATPLPVNADFQNGYAHEPAGVAANVTRCVATGCAGLSIEDATGNADATGTAVSKAHFSAVADVRGDGVPPRGRPV